jgi:hypothetical protein
MIPHCIASVPRSSATSYERITEIIDALTEAWAWLEAQGLVVPAQGTNGQNGWRRLSHRARRMESEADFAS